MIQCNCRVICVLFSLPIAWIGIALSRVTGNIYIASANLMALSLICFFVHDLFMMEEEFAFGN